MNANIKFYLISIPSLAKRGRGDLAEDNTKKLFDKIKFINAIIQIKSLSIKIKVRSDFTVIFNRTLLLFNGMGKDQTMHRIQCLNLCHPNKLTSKPETIMVRLK